MVGWLMNMDWKDFKGRAHGLIEVLSRNLAGGTGKTTKNLRIASVPAGIPTDHLKNINPEHYPYIILLHKIFTFFPSFMDGPLIVNRSGVSTPVKSCFSANGN
jgi:hypothetical protein